jgi:hypothetical protein
MYSDDCDGDMWGHIRWRGAVESARRGKRGQQFLREMLAALDALPEKKLITEELVLDGQVCAIGSVGLARGIDMTKISAEDYDAVAKTFGIAPALVREIEYMNDDAWYSDTPEQRFVRMRKWIESLIAQPGIAEKDAK